MASPASTFEWAVPIPIDLRPAERESPTLRASEIRPILHQIASLYPEDLASEQHDDVERMAHQMAVVFRPGRQLADLGGGIGLFTPGAAALGMEAHLVDDFRDEVVGRHPIDSLGIHSALGVNIVSAPVMEWGRHFGDASLDVVTCIDSLEHWHHSPRPVFREAFRVLRPGGELLLGGPNAVNLRKRLTVPLGRSNWSHFDDWFYPDEFRGHVREPTLAEMVRIVEELGFETRAAWGCNWMVSPRGRLKSAALKGLDRALRLFPTLCSDLYVLARKPA